MITFKTKGDFRKLNRFLERAKELFNAGVLNKYGEQGVKALREATPIDTGLTADSWYYVIRRSRRGGITIMWCNSNIQNDMQVAVLIQYGHATVNGNWVEGQDYINPALKPVFQSIADNVLKEVTGHE